MELHIAIGRTYKTNGRLANYPLLESGQFLTVDISKNAHSWIIYITCEGKLYTNLGVGFAYYTVKGSPELLAIREPQQDSKLKFPHLFFYVRRLVIKRIAILGKWIDYGEFNMTFESFMSGLTTVVILGCFIYRIIKGDK